MYDQEFIKLYEIFFGKLIDFKSSKQMEKGSKRC